MQGLIFGALARLALPGKDPMSIPMTIGLGIAGSFIGGLLVYLLSGGRSAGGLFVAFVCTVGLATSSGAAAKAGCCRRTPARESAAAAAATAVQDTSARTPSSSRSASRASL